MFGEDNIKFDLAQPPPPTARTVLNGGTRRTPAQWARENYYQVLFAKQNEKRAEDKI